MRMRSIVKEGFAVLHSLRLETTPNISSMYCIKRQTIWQTCDRENILILMVNGQCLFKMNGIEYIAQANDLIFIPVGQDYQRYPLGDAPACFYYFHFTLDSPPVQQQPKAYAQELIALQNQIYLSSEQSAKRPYLTACLLTKTSLGNDAQRIAREALIEYEKASLESRILYTAYLTQLIALGSRETIRILVSEKAYETDARIPPKLRDAILYIRSNHSRPLTAAEVCSHAGISPQHMIRLFRQELGMTPIQYINHTKAMHAKDIVWRNTNLSVKELAYELGFVNEHYFCRVFTRYVGETPSAFRARVHSYAQEDGAARKP
jgi:AraC-like DNA-binding protein